MSVVPKRKLGGSDIPKLLGLSPYGGPLEVYERVVLGVEAPWNPKMERGAAVEPVLRAFAQNHMGIEVEETESDYHDHPTHEFARAQIDDLAVYGGLKTAVDYKSVSRWSKGWGAPHTDQIPELIRAQVAWELLCSDRELGIVVAGFGDDAPPPNIFNISHVVPYEIERCPHFESYCVAVAREFWETHVLTQTPPPKTKRARR